MPEQPGTSHARPAIFSYAARLREVAGLQHSIVTRNAVRAARNNLAHSSTHRSVKGSAIDPATWPEISRLLVGVPEAFVPAFIMNLDLLLDRYQQAS